MDYLEFIARVTSHIPDKDQVMVRYYGLYSNAHRGKIRKAGSALSHPPIIEEEPDYVPYKGWAEMIRRIFGRGSALLSFMWWPDENHLFYQRAEDHRQDHRPPQADL